MPRPGFRLNRKTVAKILHNDKGGQAAVKAAAEKILANIDDDEAFIAEYHTDRYVNGIVVPADKQAKHGTATRAVQQARGG
jgi:hypothetical protein